MLCNYGLIVVGQEEYYRAVHGVGKHPFPWYKILFDVCH